ncbi:hypothetical protein D6783_02650 [Candidatus Woesearchaeota archaeon]|nr:MAG: hypothetical protein D6783_02650 [Candidatus Woesearchaeota archaeon]
MEEKKIPTGIPGFDKLIGGGFTPESVNLLSAGPGCGKTIFCLQFLWNGLTKYNEPGLFISFEENLVDLKRDALMFGWDFEKYIEQGMCNFIYYHPYEVRDIHNELERQIRSVNAKRVVIDSTSVYGMTMETEFEVRKGLFDLSRVLKEMHCVSLLTSEIVERGDNSGYRYSRFGVEDFLADSIILIQFESLGGEFSRSLIVRKMRRTKNDEDVHPMEISEHGIVVHDLEE